MNVVGGRCIAPKLAAVAVFVAVAVSWAGPPLAAGVDNGAPKAPVVGVFPSGQALITVQVKNGKVTGVTGTAVPASQRKPPRRASGGRTYKCTANFTNVREREGTGTSVRWYGGIGCSKSVFLSGQAYLRESATKIDATGSHYQGARKSASSGRPHTLVRAANPSLYIRHLTNVYFPRAVHSGRISVVAAAGQRVNKASRCVPVRTRAHGVGVQCDLYTPRTEFPPSGRIYEANGWLWMQNSLFTAGFDESRGAVLTSLVTSGGADVVNHWDDGMEIQTAFYDGNDYYDPTCYPCASNGWNPTEAGDQYRHGSQILSKRITASQAYFDTWANEWVPDNKGGGPSTPVPSDLHIEKWLTFEPGYNNVIRMHYRVTNVGTTSHAYGTVEFPAVYTNAAFNRLVIYGGTAPFTGAAATITPLPTVGALYHTSEMWEGAVNSANVGVVVYVPGQSAYTPAWSAPAFPSDPASAHNYFRADGAVTMAAGSVLQGDIYILPGDYRSARKTIYSLHAGQRTPHIFGPHGVLGSPKPGATISGGSVLVDGWTFDDVSPVSEVKIMVDNTFAGDATIHGPRPDVASVFPDAPKDSGYTFALNANNYAPGTHTIAIVVKSSDGYATTLRTIKVNVSP